MDEEFNIETSAYTPSPYEPGIIPFKIIGDLGYESLNPSLSPSPSEYPSEMRYVNDYYTEQAISSSLNDANSSAGGWLNSVANLLPGIANIIKSIIQPSDSLNPSASATKFVQNGVSPQTRQGSIASSESQKSSQNMTLYFIIGGVILFLLFFMRR